MSAFCFQLPGVGAPPRQWEWGLKTVRAALSASMLRPSPSSVFSEFSFVPFPNVLEMSDCDH